MKQWVNWSIEYQVCTFWYQVNQAGPWQRLLNRSASLAMPTSVLKALPGKLDIKRHSPSTVTYIRVTRHSIFQLHRYVGADITWLTPGAPFIVYTQNSDAAWETAAFIGTLKSVLRNKYRSLLHFVYSNRKKIYEIFINDMFLQCYDLSYGDMTV